MQVPRWVPASHTRNTAQRRRGGGGVASGCPQRSDGRAVGCGQPGACLGGWWWLGAAHPVLDGRTPLAGVLPAHNGHATRSSADAAPTTATRRLTNQPTAVDGPAHDNWAGQDSGPGTGPDASRPWLRRCARPRRGGRAHGWLSYPPLSGCAHRGRVALARQLSPRPVAPPCPQRHAPPCARTCATPAGRSVDPRRAAPHLGGTPDRGKAALKGKHNEQQETRASE